MHKFIDYYFWINSDWAYFGNPRLKTIAERHGLMINYYPIDFTTVFARTGGLKLPLRARERQDYRLVEMARFSKLLDMPINLQPKYPATDAHVPSMFVIAAQRLGLPLYDLIHAIMKARWVDDQNIEDPTVLATIANTMDLPASDIADLAMQGETSDIFWQNTETAISRGVFGAPFYLFKEEGFWGQDRLDMLEATIAASVASAA